MNQTMFMSFHAVHTSNYYDAVYSYSICIT